MMILLVASLWGGAGLCGKGGSRQVYEFSDTEAGCTATVRIEGSHVRIRNTVVDADPVNCDVVVEYEGSHMTASSAATSDCGSGEGSGSGGFLWGPSTERAFATGCGADEVVTLTR